MTFLKTIKQFLNKKMSDLPDAKGSKTAYVNANNMAK